MSLKDQLKDDLKAAMREQAEPQRTVLRTLLSAIRNAEIESGGELDEVGVTAVLAKQVKQREESIAAAGDRTELIATEQAEAAVIKAYLPEQLSEVELQQLVTAAISETGASSPADMGKVMGALKPRIAGRADGGVVAGMVKSSLA